MAPRLLGLAYEGVANARRGVSLAPAHIRFHLRALEDLSPWQEGELLYEDLGDLYPPWVFGREFVDWALEALKPLRPPYLLLGGDHLVTLPSLLHLSEHGISPTVLWLDAHLDMRDRYLDGRYSHATVGARVREMGLTVLAIRPRAPSPEEPACDALAEDLTALWEAVEGVEGPLYISLDMDFLDPAVAPGVGDPEPGGPGFREVVEFLVGLRGRVVAADLVEYNPLIREETGATAAALARELLLVLSDHQ